MCPSCGEDADGYFDLPEAVYEAGVYHRKTHYGAGSHTPSAWGVFSYGDHLARFGFRLFDWLMFNMRLDKTPELEKYIERISLPDGREGEYFRAVLQSFYDIFVKFEQPLN
ncbi:MAG: hypothetical protein GF309_08905 [Candidatus Lokiarchaeota archaeon]|nr:hypothetical protein [Candidatus Lokiarchaeota archaeon]